MIKHLKRKYISIVMVAVTLVLGIIITAINITSYTSVNSQLNDKLMLIVENEGKMPDFPLPEAPDEDESEKVENEDGESEDNDDSSDEENITDPDEENKETGDGSEADDEASEENGEDKKKDEKKDDEDEKKEDVRQHMSPETPFETR